MITPKRYALGHLKAGAMNKTEANYGAYLERLRMAGTILWYRFEGVKLRLADKTFYTPDFAVMTSENEIQMHEVKGFWEDDARAKIKIAAEQYPFRFLAVTVQSARKGGGWCVEYFD